MICSRRFRLPVFLALVLAAAVVPRASAVDWPPIDPADLAMKDLPQQPGAPAVILRREEIDDDLLHFHDTYERIKILTEPGRQFASIEIPYGRRNFHIVNITGRTIHADGSIVPFDGKTFDKTVFKARGVRVQVKSFTLPDVQVGSIIEYRYSQSYDNGLFFEPEWEIQRNLFQKSAYFQYIPFQFDSQFRHLQIGHGQAATEVAWTPYVPNKEMAPKVINKLKTTIELHTSDVPPFLEEPNSPPEQAMKWRVSFYYTAGFKPEDYWKREGKFWSKDVEGFLSHHESAQEILAKTVATGDTPEQKVRKIYDFVAGLENRSYIPHRGAEEAKVLDIRYNKFAEDVLQQRSGYHDELNRLFVALLREAGLAASMIWVPDRSELFFDPNFLSTRQLDAEVAIVQLNGKEVFLDPGTKYCPYGGCGTARRTPASRPRGRQR